MKLNIKNEYLYKGSREAFFQKMEYYSKKRRVFNYVKSENFEDEFKVEAKLSVGTAISNGGLRISNPITIYGIIETENDNEHIVELKTETRLEIGIILLISIIIYIVAFSNISEIPFWLYFLPPVMLGWFHFVFRYQEKILLKKILRNIELELVNEL